MAVLQGSVHPLGCFAAKGQEYLYATVLTFYRGKLLLARRADRQTWEQPGGHIEPGETPEQAARRELYEETGAARFTLRPLCDYAAAGTCGVCFVAEVEELGEIPKGSEMAEARLFEALPEETELTYPGITPGLVAFLLAGQQQ